MNKTVLRTLLGILYLASVTKRYMGVGGSLKHQKKKRDILSMGGV